MSRKPISKREQKAASEDESVAEDKNDTAKEDKAERFAAMKKKKGKK